jgi:nicotinamide-nucleotide amidase
MTPRNRVQALFPTGAVPIPNQTGTAPGIWLAMPRTGRSPVVFIAFPGVPNELKLMFENEIKPRLTQRFAERAGIILERKINTFGLGEAALEEKVLDLTRRGHVPEVGITASDGTISLRIFGQGKSVTEAEVQIAPAETAIRQRLGDLVFGTGEEELQHAVARCLETKKKTLAVAESLTGGLVMYRLCHVPGISNYFMGGCVAYSNEAKVSQLGVSAELIAKHGAVSGEVAEAMANGARQRFKTDLAVSTTGIAGPSGATANKPIGLAYVGIAWEGGVKHHQVNWIGSERLDVMSRTSKAALNQLRLLLMNQ